MYKLAQKPASRNDFTSGTGTNQKDPTVETQKRLEENGWSEVSKLRWIKSQQSRGTTDFRASGFLKAKPVLPS
ncbi:hypothetical protein OUZ56_030863 [Daphnia magna]|uniref:Uncharacterized protein n=1 Tax=Daphnia magna TaxID=35525 RepID=A0ABQ9ZT32_9CRUS|nr:hypothetical protein OUZ56_030863 [Daphnia magna]